MDFSKLMRAEKRPCADHPVLSGEESGELNQLWVDAAWACAEHAEEKGTADMNREEICLAVSASLMGEIPNGGTRQWLLWNMRRPDLAAHAAQALRHMGSRGMADFIERIIAVYLGPRDAWADLTPGEWRGHQNRREKLLEKDDPYAAGVTARTSLEEMGMEREEWLDFLFECKRALAETGETDRYRRWYDAHAQTTPDPEKTKKTWSFLHPLYTRFAKRPEAGVPVLAGQLHVRLNSRGEGMYCHPLSPPHNAGGTGFWYWENELEAMAYRFTGDNIAKIRRELRKS